MIRDIKKCIMKILSCALVMALLLQNFVLLAVYASPATGTPGNNLPSKVTLKPNNKIEWRIASIVVAAINQTWAPNYFHNQVQNDIRSSYEGFLNKDLHCKYSIKYLDGKTEGYADLSKEITDATASDFGTTYIWEVKPVVYGLNAILKKNNFYHTT